MPIYLRLETTTLKGGPVNMAQLLECGRRGGRELDLTSWMRGARVSQSVKHPTLGFGSGRDLGFRSSSPASGLGILSPPLSAPPPFTLSLKNK